MMNIIKITYSSVRVNNYQGGSGKTVINEDYISIGSEESIKSVSEKVKNHIKSIESSNNYADENCVVMSVELINVIDYIK